MVQCLLEFSQTTLILHQIMQVNILLVMCISRNILLDEYLSHCLSGLLMGMTNMAATIPGLLVPAIVGALTHGVVNTLLKIIFYFQ